MNIFKITIDIDTRISFYSHNTHLLPPKPKTSFRHLKRGIHDFHMNYVLVPARLYYINTVKLELVDTKACKLVVIQPYISVSRLKKSRQSSYVILVT